ncbi:MAG: hypothetical protein EB023_14055 [Flavobacteriia bacterium]|nr:hypothetical protein [Flavobacteriia bacterium]
MSKIVGLQIGGTVGPDDQVGMHVVMPTSPGIGVQININTLDDAAREIAESIPNDHPKTEQIKKIVNEILETQDRESKLKKAHTLVMVGAGITQIALAIGKMAKLLGF